MAGPLPPPGQAEADALVDGPRPAIDEQYVGDAQLVDLMDDLITRSREGNRTRVELDWFVNTRWYAGEPWFRQTEDGLLEWLKPEKRERYINVNRVFEVVESLCGHMVYDPKADAMPTSIDPDDIFRARASADLANHLIRQTKLGDVFSTVVRDVHVCGHGFIKVGWDPTAGPMQPIIGQMPCDMCGGSRAVPAMDGIAVPCPKCTAQGVLPAPQGPGMLEAIIGQEPMGDVYAEAVHPWELFHDSADMDNLREVVQETRMSKSEAWMRFGRYVGLSEDDMETGGFSDKFPEMNIDLDPLGGVDRSSSRVTVREYWAAPSEKYPDGLYGVAIGKDVITFGRMPLIHKRVPYVVFKGYEVAGSPYPKSTVDYILPLIFVLNDLVSALRARAVQSVKLRVMARHDSALRWEEKGGIGVLKHNETPGRSVPRELQFGPAPSDTNQLVGLLVQWVNEISGALDILRGQSPAASSDSARALAWLEDRAGMRFKHMRMRFAKSLEKVIRIMLETAKLFYHDGRTLSLFGSSKGAVTLRAYKLDDVASSADVVIDVSPDMYRSRAARMSELNEAMKVGGLQNPEFMKRAEFGGNSEWEQTRAMHEAKATWENNQLRSTGVVDYPIEGEDHQVHIDTMFKAVNDLRMQPQSPQRDFLIQAGAEHINAHKFVAAQEQFRVQVAQMQAAQAFGMAGASNPQNQTQGAQNAAAAAGGVGGGPAPQPVVESGGPPGTQESLKRAKDASKRTG